MGYFYIYLLLILIILFFSYYNSLHASVIEEGFTPHIRSFYRPYVRHARIFKDKLYGNMEEKVKRLLRKMGLLK